MYSLGFSDKYRILLSRYPPLDQKSSYINAIQVDGFRAPAKYIVTQQPMPNTLGDFWRMVVEHRSSLIISLNDIDLKNKVRCLFLLIELRSTSFYYIFIFLLID